MTIIISEIKQCIGQSADNCETPMKDSKENLNRKECSCTTLLEDSTIGPTDLMQFQSESQQVGFFYNYTQASYQIYMERQMLE